MRNLLTAACLALCAAPAAAWEVADVVSLRVLPGYRAANGQHFAAFQIDLAPGWKTYWRAPGEAGIPPVVTWEGSQNIQAAQFHWPVPQVFNQSGMQSIGYAGQVTLPIEISVADSSAPIHLSGQLQIGVCEEICVPVSFSFDHI
ncbi:MAG: hypothetical protein JKX69_09980, partial [Rhodobacteraceae bacterium]|nr:hypothetical protein [Paracoccaceae bacterium]